MGFVFFKIGCFPTIFSLNATPHTHRKTREFTNRGGGANLKTGVVDRGSMCVCTVFMGRNWKKNQNKQNKIFFFLFTGQELNANSDRPYRELPTEYS